MRLCWDKWQSMRELIGAEQGHERLHRRQGRSKTKWRRQGRQRRMEWQNYEKVNLYSTARKKPTFFQITCACIVVGPFLERTWFWADCTLPSMFLQLNIFQVRFLIIYILWRNCCTYIFPPVCVLSEWSEESKCFYQFLPSRSPTCNDKESRPRCEKSSLFAARTLEYQMDMKKDPSHRQWWLIAVSCTAHFLYIQIFTIPQIWKGIHLKIWVGDECCGRAKPILAT